MGGMSIRIKETDNFELWLYEDLSYETPRFQFRLRYKNDKNDENEVFIPASMIGMDYYYEKHVVEILKRFWKELK